MKSIRHWNPQYIRNRLALMQYQRKNPQSPWLTADAIRLLEQWLTHNDKGLETGSGRSTHWFAKRTGHVTSIEHDSEWAQRVRSSLEKDRLDKNVDLHLCPDGSDEQARNSYVNVIEGLKPSSLDYCLIDGVSRGHCALAAIPKLKPGGLMIVDNVNWYVPRNPPSQAPNSITSGSDEFTTEWKLFQRITADWRCIWTSNGVWDTAFWFKPVSSQD